MSSLLSASQDLTWYPFLDSPSFLTETLARMDPDYNTEYCNTDCLGK